MELLGDEKIPNLLTGQTLVAIKFTTTQWNQRHCLSIIQFSFGSFIMGNQVIVQLMDRLFVLNRSNNFDEY